MADAADGEDEFSFLLDQTGYFSQQKEKLLFGHAEKLFIRHDIPHFKLSYQLIKHVPLLSRSPGNPLPHIHFPISLSEASPRLRRAKGPNRERQALSSDIERVEQPPSLFAHD